MTVCVNNVNEDGFFVERERGTRFGGKFLGKGLGVGVFHLFWKGLIDHEDLGGLWDGDGTRAGEPLEVVEDDVFVTEGAARHEPGDFVLYAEAEAAGVEHELVLVRMGLLDGDEWTPEDEGERKKETLAIMTGVSGPGGWT